MTNRIHHLHASYIDLTVRFRLWQLLALVTIAGIGFWAITQIGTNVARYEINAIYVHHDQQWDKYWSKIEWHVHLPEYQKGDSFTSFIEVDKEFESAGYKQGDILGFRFQETRFLQRQKQNPKKVLIDKLFAVEGNILEDNGGDVFAGPYPTIPKDESEADWE